VFGRSDGKKEAKRLAEETFTFLARGFEFKGILTFDGMVRIDGTVSGEIHTKGTVILGEHAVIEGDVIAGTIVSSGKINGNVTATEKVRLLSPAVLLGTIKAPLLSVEEGARFHGACEADGKGAERLHEEPRAPSPPAPATPHLTQGRFGRG
jgi:cytoskeletal protein CcmA (bactofilin family)